MKLGNLLKKFKPLFNGVKNNKVDVGVVGSNVESLGPIPGKVDYKRLMQSAGKVTWPMMRGIMFPKTRRIYKKRQQLWIRGGAITRFETPDSKKISYRDARLWKISESQRQGVQIAKERRKAYVARRSARWLWEKAWKLFKFIP